MMIFMPIYYEDSTHAVVYVNTVENQENTIGVKEQLTVLAAVSGDLDSDNSTHIGRLTMPAIFDQGEPKTF